MESQDSAGTAATPAHLVTVASPVVPGSAAIRGYRDSADRAGFLETAGRVAVQGRAATPEHQASAVIPVRAATPEPQDSAAILDSAVRVEVQESAVTLARVVTRAYLGIQVKAVTVESQDSAVNLAILE